VDPPKVMESFPQNYSKNFDQKKIEIVFDEFIVLDNVNQELVISPPLPDRTDVRLKNKSILIEMENELRDSTTYTLNFGQAIKDNNEGNLLENFEFVFSTGDYLDSLSVYGQLLNAIDNKPPEDPVSIMLYDHLYDSVVYKEKPVYIGKTDKNGYFALNNLRPDTFKVFALKDVNFNSLFDLPNEEIAFLDSLIYLTPEFFSRFVPDTTQVDSVISVDTEEEAQAKSNGFRKERSGRTIGENKKNEKQKEKFRFGKKENFDKILIELYLFTEKNEKQFLDDNSRDQNNLLEFNFNLPVSDSFHFRSLIPDNEDWYLYHENVARDSFQLWVTDSTVIKSDSVFLELNYLAKDSLFRDYVKTDSVMFIYREPVTKSKKNKNKEEKEKEGLKLVFQPKGKTLELNASTWLQTKTPILAFDSSKINFLRTVDTLQVPTDFRLFSDSLSLLKTEFKTSLEPNTEYQFTVYPGAFTDIYGQTNDTITQQFTTRKSDYYGALLVNVTGTKGDSVIVQVLDEKEKVLRTSYINEDQVIRYDYMKPTAYKLKCIYDRNGNGKWDTGKYLEKIQPERVKYYKGDVSVRSNWDVEIEFKLNQP